MITIARKRSNVIFENLAEGQFFLFDEDLYLKTCLVCDAESIYNAYQVEEDEVGYSYFDEDDEVVPVDVKITIFERKD